MKAWNENQYLISAHYGNSKWIQNPCKSIELDQADEANNLPIHLVENGAIIFISISDRLHSHVFVASKYIRNVEFSYMRHILFAMTLLTHKINMRNAYNWKYLIKQRMMNGNRKPNNEFVEELKCCTRQSKCDGIFPYVSIFLSMASNISMNLLRYIT